jgi:hypothetical protein
VTDEPPVVGAFSTLKETTGASNVKIMFEVPVKVWSTLMFAVPEPCPDEHETVLTEDQLVVAQSAVSPSLVVGVRL